MNRKTVSEIINETTTGHKGLLLSKISKLIPSSEIEKGFSLLKKEDAESILKMIDFNFKAKSLLLNELLRIESFITTRFLYWIGNKGIEEIEQTDFSSEHDYQWFLNFYSSKQIFHNNKIKINEIFNKLTFGDKVLTISMINFAVIENVFYIHQKFSKKEFIKVLKLCVEVRNIVAHQTFIVNEFFFESLPTQPRKKDNLSSLEYFVLRVDEVNSIFGYKGINRRIRALSKPYSTYLRVTKLINL